MLLTITSTTPTFQFSNVPLLMVALDLIMCLSTETLKTFIVGYLLTKVHFTCNQTCKRFNSDWIDSCESDGNVNSLWLSRLNPPVGSNESWLNRLYITAASDWIGNSVIYLDWIGRTIIFVMGAKWPCSRCAPNPNKQTNRSNDSITTVGTALFYSSLTLTLFPSVSLKWSSHADAMHYTSAIFF